MPDPIEQIEWRQASELNGNSYNPNVVHMPELRLLERSIILTGYVQPILIAPDGTIIDGFHRVMLARESKALKARYGGKVPCAVIKASRGDAMMLTIRMNRAKGTHVALRMSKIVRELVNELHYAPEEVAAEIGATMAEVELLLQEGVFKAKKSAEHAYSRAWYPAETNAPN
jgi:ParB-like chromosome segregation protein Spo0J